MDKIMVKRCAVCGGSVKRTGVDCGYSSAESLGRPAGAKGRDEFIVFDACTVCGSIDITEAPAPCLICGAESTQGLYIALECPEAQGEHIPGLDTVVPICASADCRTKLATLITTKLDEASGAGYFDD